MDSQIRPILKQAVIGIFKIFGILLQKPKQLGVNFQYFTPEPKHWWALSYILRRTKQREQYFNRVAKRYT